MNGDSGPADEMAQHRLCCPVSTCSFSINPTASWHKAARTEPIGSASLAGRCGPGPTFGGWRCARVLVKALQEAGMLLLYLLLPAGWLAVDVGSHFGQG